MFNSACHKGMYQLFLKPKRKADKAFKDLSDTLNNLG